uniref:Uncharacterized protein n=1 Tax=Chromera velia CCMP2878 TaxID=1169474 RepID=A0A0G4G1Y4_9ALVE|eukprot:Cvel_4079.t1-p1 / transcript=Cvel_4079.t1 / gene=Cvel_4079 / organism=Chromera_velia_CCMP2878 / gene_product=hypothetical protein / transcript_product=hypothetical protein / location=Cvel_scaffold173:116225-116587(-) / protein_length=76 / sequence_SO=supercontig / SO=protein_coding / is_pseudo=false
MSTLRPAAYTFIGTKKQLEKHLNADCLTAGGKKRKAENGVMETEEVVVRLPGFAVIQKLKMNRGDCPTWWYGSSFP